jgi:hypothetical protein
MNPDPEANDSIAGSVIGGLMGGNAATPSLSPEETAKWFVFVLFYFILI